MYYYVPSTVALARAWRRVVFWLAMIVYVGSIVAVQPRVRLRYIAYVHIKYTVAGIAAMAAWMRQTLLRTHRVGM